MSSFPTTFARIPTLLAGQQSLASLQRTNFQIFQTGQQLSTGRDVLKPSDNPIKASTIALMDARLERSEQILKNLEYAAESLDTLDNAVGDTAELVNEALSIASTQINSTASPEERESQAIIVDSLIDSLYRIALRESLVGYVFGGSRPGTPPVEDIGGAFRFNGTSRGLTTDIGLSQGIPVTLGASNGVGAVSARVEGTIDLNPALSPDTNLADLNGARALGVSAGPILFSFDANPAVQIDLTGSVTIDDVADKITAALRQYETDNAVSILGPGGVAVGPSGLTIDSPNADLVFSDLQGSTIGADLGIVFDPPAAFNTTFTDGGSLNPRLTWQTQIADLDLANPLGQIIIKNNARTFTRDLSAATTLADLRSLIEEGGTGLRVELNDDATGINIFTEIAGTSSRAFSIANGPDGLLTAEALGIRTFARDTPVTLLNDARGVQVKDGAVAPDGTPAPQFDVDFVITLGDGFEIDIDLAPTDLTSVGNVVDAINAQIAAALTAAGRPTTDLTVTIPEDRNGLALVQDPALPGVPRVAPDNNSTAADQLGLLDLDPGAAPGTMIGKDPATVRVDNLFTALLDLSEALRSNDRFGMQLASDRLQDMSKSLAETRGLVGGYARRVDDETRREEDKVLLDTSVRSQLRDVDFAEASSRLALLNTQLQAGLTVAAQVNRQTLLDFIG
jgi:flagellin-like hook-associated protein FlgL